MRDLVATAQAWALFLRGYEGNGAESLGGDTAFRKQHGHGTSERTGEIMIRIFVILALGAGLAGCVAPQPDGYGYGDPGYRYGPGYYAPRTGIGIGVGGGSIGGGVGAGVGVGF
ncbi:hypothetical protein LMG28138_04692 [Pararobbsia alpina]|uniref:Uncharacterized protein n=2 Tax=Pararobbsia alpina TaxID=621374 RepID=A0A6S7BQZ8_9BURK|nr:hypothetical protein LMG28138_04692 [Pararobbsia alpina]